MRIQQHQSHILLPQNTTFKLQSMDTWITRQLTVHFRKFIELTENNEKTGKFKAGFMTGYGFWG